MSETLGTKIAEFLLTQGWAGIIVLLMGAVIWDQRKDIKSLRERNGALQDLRVAEAQDLTTRTLMAIETTRAAVQGFTEAIRNRGKG